MRTAQFHAPVFVLLLMSDSSAQTASDPANIYTLYRSAAYLPGGPSDTDRWRIHVATFDAAEEAAYNQENCQIASRLFAEQSGVVVRYWCEQGTYKGPVHPPEQ